MRAKLGINPIGWSNDDLRALGGETPLETCLAEARLAGYDGIELGHKFPRDAALLRPILDRHGLALVSGWYSTAVLARDAAAEGWRTRRMALLKSSSSSCCVLPRLNCGPSARFPALSIASRASTAPLTAWGSGRRGRGAARSVRGAAHHHRSAPA